MRLFAIGLGCLMAWSACAAPVDVKGIRTWPAPDHTRIVLDIDRPVEYALFVLRDPDRVVIDLRDARLLKRVPRARSGDRLLERIRAAQRKRSERRGRDGTSNNLRVVLDMKQRVRPKSFLLKAQCEVRPPSRHRRPSDRWRGGSARWCAGRARTALPKGNRKVVVAVDAGHGGEDPGAVTRSEHPGKERRARHSPRAQAPDRPHAGDEGGPSSATATTTSASGAGPRSRAVTTRICSCPSTPDSFRDPRVRGSSVYVLSRRGASSEAARWLAQQENASDFVGGVSIDDKDDVLASVLVDLQQTATLSASAEVGGQVLNSLGGVGRRHKRRIEKAGFLVLKSPDIPSILVETGFLTNPSDAKRLSNPKHQEKVARAILDGIHRYFDANPLPGTTFASTRRHTIARGETLSEIAERYRVSVKRLRDANRIRGSVIRAGEVLRIPGRSDG